MIDLTSRLARLTPAQRELFERRLQESPRTAEPIAIVGMACRFPGAGDLESFWRIIRDGIDATGEVPLSRWDAEAIYDPDGDTPGKTNVRWGGFVDDVDQFDPTFFGITPREASRMDPQQRLLLEVAWESLEHANLPADRMAGSRTGVFVGIGGTDYSKIPLRYDDFLERIDAHVGTGNALSIAANRLSYVLDLRGPSFAVDTACSSGLVALHAAVQSLRNHEADAALAGAVNLILSPEVTVAFSKARMLSSDGRCRPFDSDANGYVRGEGCGIIVLKRLTDAVRDGDNVLAVIRGAAVNQDGRTSGITAPNSQAQQEVIRAALAQAGLSPEQINYIEAHGTGTPLGDPIEFQSLTQLFRRQSESEPPCYVTSVKANIGHTETVSGIAGLIKVVLMMQRGTIYPQLHFQELNPNIHLEGSRLQIPSKPVAWNHGQLLRAGVSSFGFGGTNTHIVVEQATPQTIEDPRHERPQHLLAISAKNEDSLKQLAHRFAERIRDDASLRIGDLCYSANTGRTHFNHRLAISAGDVDELCERLTSWSAGKTGRGVCQGRVKLLQRPKIAMLFTGQGSQYVGMGKRLYDTQPVFRAALDECDEILRHYLDQPLLDVLFAEGEVESPLLNETAYTQPALFAFEYAMARLWQSWGIVPDMVLGHSVGEYAAACVAGVFSLEDGLRLIAVRGQLMQQLPAGGKMAAVFAPRAEVEELVAAHAGSVSVAAINGPESIVISGEGEVVDQLLEDLERRNVKVQRLTVSHAFHSPLMEPMLEEFEDLADGLDYHPPAIPLVSNLTAEVIEESAPTARYWRDHVRSPVRFAEGMDALLERKPDVLLEVGPQPHLIGMARRFAKSDAAWLPSSRQGQDDWQAILKSLSELYCLGADIDWNGFDQYWTRRRVHLPTYPFQRSSLWFETGKPAAGFSAGRGQLLHPLLGCEVPSALKTRLFESRLSDHSPNYLKDHVVQGSIVVPGAAFLETALAAAEQALGEGMHAIEDFSIQQSLFLAAGSSRITQTSVSPESGGEATFETYSCSTEAEKLEWTMHACGRIVHADAVSSAQTTTVDVGDLLAKPVAVLPREEIYEMIAQRGLAYGPMFQVLGTVHRSNDAAVADVELPEATQKQLGDYRLHPALLDGLLQMMASIVPLEADGSYSPFTYMPTAVKRLRIFGELTDNMRIYARRTSPGGGDGEEATPSPEIVLGDVSLLDADGNVLVQLEGVRIQRVGKQGDADREEDVGRWFYNIQWKHQPLPVVTASNDESVAAGTWVLLADRQGFAETLARQLREAGGRAVLVQPGEQYAKLGEDRFRLDSLASDQYAQLISDVSSDDQPPLRGVVHLWSRGVAERGEEGASLENAMRFCCGSALRTIQACARCSAAKPPALWIVTSQGQSVDRQEETTPLASSLWGLGRVAALEHPELRCRLVDLPAGEEAVAAMLLQEMVGETDESQIAFRHNERFVARLRRTANEEKSEDEASTEIVIPPQAPSRLRLAQAGSFDGLTVEPCDRIAPSPGHVEIEVRATGLNFSDVLKALGLYPGIKDDVVPLGIECGGVVTRVGEGVDRFQVGDEVMGVAPYSFATHAITTEYALVKKPASLDFEEAATVPITFLTAYYALVRLADLQPGERVLIHAGAGGVGLAAIQIAQHIGAEIFTTAGSQQKRDYLRTLGAKHVFNSRTVDFADEILDLTNREGVDVVLNSLPGEAIAKSLSILRAYGRFLEIGKIDIYADRKIGLAPFQDNLSYFAIDLDRMLRQRPDYIRRLFAEMMEHFETGVYQPLPLTQFEYANVRESFRYMAQRKNIGKLVVSIEHASDDADAEPAAPEEDAPPAIREDATYLITGGLGALGLRVAQWFVDQGAKHLALLGRRPPNEHAAEVIDRLAGDGVQVAAVQGDVADYESLRRAIAQIPNSYPPLRGVIHAAGVLDDGVLFDMDLEKLQRPLFPKVAGGWNLHAATLDAPLELFVCFSSVAATLGSPGQGNYAAGNAYLDGLAAWRRAQGRPAVSIAWGPWADSGMAKDAGGDEQMADRGMELLDPERALEALSGILRRERSAHVAVMSVRWADLLALHRNGAPSLLRDIAADTDVESAASAADEVDHAMRAKLLSVDDVERADLLQQYFADQLAKIMGLDADDLEIEQPLNTLGLDSLMAIELKNTVEARLRVSIPMAQFMEGPSIASLSNTVAELLSDDAGSSEGPPSEKDAPQQGSADTSVESQPVAAGESDASTA